MADEQNGQRINIYLYEVDIDMLDQLVEQQRPKSSRSQLIREWIWESAHTNGEIPSRQKQPA